MNHPSQAFLTTTNAGHPPNYERIKEEYEVAELGGPHGPTSVRTIVIKMPREPRDRKIVGDITGSQAYTSITRCLSIRALVFSTLMIIVTIILVWIIIL